MEINLSTVIAIGSGSILAVAAVSYALRERRLREIIAEREEKQKHHFFETSILKEIQDRIGYSLNPEKVIDVITGSLDNIFTYTSYSALILKDDRMTFKICVKENVSRDYIEDIKKVMIGSLHELVSPLPPRVEEAVTGVTLDSANTANAMSYFNVPLIINNKPMGVITIASTKRNFYKEEQMNFVYKITDLASNTLSRLEDVLNMEKSKLMAMIGSLTDGVFMVDTDSKLTIINNAAKNFLNISKDNPNIIDVLSALPNVFDFGAKIQEVIAQNHQLEEKDVLVDERLFKVTITPVLDLTSATKQNVIGASVLLHDVTLEKSVAQMKEDFTSVIVHELRSPLTAIKASTELLSSSADLTPEEKDKLLHMIYDQSNRLLDQVSLILDAAKLDAGLFNVRKITADIKKVVAEKAALFNAPAQEKMVSLVTEIDSGIPEFLFDPVQVGKVITNLISNSMKFTPTGGTIRVSARLLPGKVTVAVSDTGAGIPKEKQKYLFSKFSQASTAGSNFGTGLGLYIVKGVTDAHGGNVAVESEEGHGTTIAITLPVDTSPVAKPSGLGSIPSSPRPMAN